MNRFVALSSFLTLFGSSKLSSNLKLMAKDIQISNINASFKFKYCKAASHIAAIAVSTQSDCRYKPYVSCLQGVYRLVDMIHIELVG